MTGPAVTPVPAPAPRVRDELEPTVELWPSVGEYPVYDALIYHVMTHDGFRNDRYREALRRIAPGRVVADLGTGQDLLWARAALDAGARKVYGVESLERPAKRAADLAASLGLGEALTVVHGYSQDVDLGEPADVCVIEMVGSIGSAEGITAVAADAVRRLLADGGAVVPGRVTTRACGVTLPDELARDPGFSLDAADYVEQIWAVRGGPGDVRLSIRGVEPADVLTSAADVEDLDLGGRNDPSGEVTVTLTAQRPGRLDGLLLWTRVWPLPGTEATEEPIETFPTVGSGLPAYVPLFHPGVALAAGDTVEVGFRRTLSPDGFHPDYRFTAAVRSADGSDGSAAAVELPYRGGPLAQNGFYAALWSA